MGVGTKMPCKTICVQGNELRLEQKLLRHMHCSYESWFTTNPLSVQLFAYVGWSWSLAMAFSKNAEALESRRQHS